MDRNAKKGEGRRPAGWLIVAILLGVHGEAPGAKVETWRLDTATEFAKGKKERVVVSDAGRVRLARSLADTAPIDAAHVWDLARTDRGVLFAATGDAGKVFRREGGAWTVAFDGEDSQALALAVLPGGHVFAGTGPGGRVVDLTDPKQPSSRPDPGVQYIWGLAADPAGNLYAATGPTGQLWKRSAEGKWSLLLDSKHAHLLCVAVGPDGSVYAGSDGEGLVYRVAPGEKVSVLYDAPQNEVRSLLLAPDGSLYAGTASTSGGTGVGPLRGVPTTSAGEAPTGTGRRFIVATAFSAEPQRKDEPRREGPSGGTASPRPAAPGENAVYRIAPDGAVREVFRAKALVFALAWQGDRLLIGTGPEGILYEIRDRGHESSPIARLDSGQILALLGDPGGDLYLGASDPGAVRRLAPGHAKEGVLTTDVLDAKLNSRFGALTWRAETPAGTLVAVQARTGNVGEPDDTWSDWSPPATDPASARADVPPGRFAQVRLNLKTDDPAASPEVRSLSLSYQTVNLPPEVGKITVPDLAAGDGATKADKLSLKWDANDPNGDDLTFSVAIRKDGWPDWIGLGREPLTGRSFDWDATAVPGGIYRLRIRASDRPSNAPGEALEAERTSEPFVVDHQAPFVTVSPKASKVIVGLKDDLTRLVKAAYAIDGGEWVPIFPDDGLFDAKAETITIDLADLKAGSHILMVRATDAAGNTGTGDAVIVAP